MKTSLSILILAGATVLLPLSLLYAQETGDPQMQEVGRTTEKELKVVLSSASGTLIIERGEREKMLIIESGEKNRSRDRVVVDYEIRNRVGYADVTLGENEEKDGKKGSFKLKDLDGGKWFARFSDAVPISFDVKLGFGRGDFDLSGLQVKDFNLSTGASDVSLAFDEPNRSSIENVNIETGFSKFEGRNLGNANFKHFRFQGGVGTYRLDFSGHISNEVDVDIELGMGFVTLVVPPEVGVKIYHEKTWVSRLDCDRDFTTSGDNEQVSDNYDSASGKVNIRVDSGVGSIKVRRK